MSRFTVVTALASAMGVAVSLASPVAFAADAMAPALVKCYGVNALAKNDCAAGAHSCAGQSTSAKDPKSFVLVPTGTCAKLDGGSLNPA